MNTENAGAEAPAAEESVTVENAPEATAGQQADAEQGDAAPAAEQGDDLGDDAAAKPRKKPGVHNRIDELTRQKHEALREAEYWRKRAEEAQSTNIDDLDYDDQIIAKVRITERQERAEAAERTAKDAVARQFTELENDARERWVDYDVVTRNPNLPITPAMAAIIQESEMGPELAYHFGKNPAEAGRLAPLQGTALAREIGRLEARLSQPRTAPKVPAAPIKPVSALAAGGVKDPGDMSMAEYMAWRAAGNG